MESSSSSVTDLNDLDKFIDDCEKRISKIFGVLNWDRAETLKISKTLEVSNTKYNKNENEPQTENCDPYLPEPIYSKYSIRLDDEKLNELIQTPVNIKKKLVPQKFSDMQLNFTRDEKLTIYNKVIEQTGKLTEPEMVVPILPCDQSASTSAKKQMSLAEIVAYKRNLKRRRLKHRTTKLPPLTYTEELRGLIDLQSQTLKQYSESKADRDDYDKTAQNYEKMSNYDKHYSDRDRNEHRREYTKQKPRYRSRSRDCHRKTDRRRHSRSNSRSKLVSRRNSIQNSDQNDQYKYRSRSRSRKKIKSEKYRRSSSRKHKRSRSKHKKRKKERHRSKNRR